MIRSLGLSSMLASVLVWLLSCSTVSAAVWTHQELVSPADAYTDYQPEVRIDPQERIWVTWMGKDPGGSHDSEIYFSRNDGVGWSAPARVHADNTNRDAWPRLGMSADGTPWVLWLRQRSGAYDLLLSRYVSGAWTSPTVAVGGPQVSEDNYYGLAPVDSSDCWVVYDQMIPAYAREYHDGTWGPIETVVPSVSTRCWQVDAATGSDGEPWAIWAVVGDGVYASHRLSGGTWESAVDLNPGQHTTSYLPRITVDGGGEAWAVWQSSEACQGGAYVVYYSTTSESLWQPLGVAVDPDSTTCSNNICPTISAAYGWSPRVAWIRRYPWTADLSTKETYGSCFDGQMWGPQGIINVPDSAQHVEDNYPDIAIGPSGGAAAVWLRQDPLSTNVYASQLLFDVVQLEVTQSQSYARIQWRNVGSGPREIYRLRVVRGEPGGLTTTVADFQAAEDSYSIVDEEPLEPGVEYWYWVEVFDFVSEAFLFRTHPRLIAGAQVSVPNGGPSRVRLPDLEVLPNPAAHYVEFRASGVPSTTAVEVFDVQGRRVWRGIGVHHSGDSTESLAMRWTFSHEPPAGRYWARLALPRGGVPVTRSFVVAP